MCDVRYGMWDTDAVLEHFAMHLSHISHRTSLCAMRYALYALRE
jgi:hypothetical protein